MFYHFLIELSQYVVKSQQFRNIVVSMFLWSFSSYAVVLKLQLFGGEFMLNLKYSDYKNIFFT